MSTSSLPGLSHITAGLTAVIVGYSSAVVLVIKAAQASGADAGMIVSWLLMLGLGMGITCIGFSWFYKVPVVTAWSTPGAAFLIGAAGGFSLAEVIGAFVIAALLALIAARSRFITTQIERIPPAVSSAMLAGILLPVCLGIFSDAPEHPLLVVIFISVYLLGTVWFPRYSMLILLAVALVAGMWEAGEPAMAFEWAWPVPVWVAPAFTLSATVSLAVPLFLITLLSQNLPGIAILKSYDYHPDVRQVLSGVYVVNLITAPFGGFALNLAAITAAICMGENAGTDRQQRYKAGIMAGAGYLLFGVLASLVVYLFSQMPLVVVHLLAGLALFSTLQASLIKALDDQAHRKAALLTFLCCASGITVAQLGAPVWGLLAGLCVLGLDKLQARIKSKRA